MVQRDISPNYNLEKLASKKKNKNKIKNSTIGDLIKRESSSLEQIKLVFFTRGFRFSLLTIIHALNYGQF